MASKDRRGTSLANAIVSGDEFGFRVTKAFDWWMVVERKRNVTSKRAVGEGATMIVALQTANHYFISTFWLFLFDFIQLHASSLSPKIMYRSKRGMEEKVEYYFIEKIISYL